MDCEKPMEINLPDPLPDFNAPNNVGTWKQLFAANIGRRVKIEIALFDGTVRSICGDLYLVGNSYVGVTCGDKLCFADIFAIKFASFY